MGDIGCELTDDQIGKLKGCDLLLIPVGGFFTIGCKEAFDLCQKIDPKVVVPMHYRGETFGYDVISGREEFVELVRNAGGRAIVNGGNSVDALPEEKSLLLLDPLRIL
jgi:L-ascorbate metabolism protein UlaG (beta-lactamase superfamily)